MKHGCVYCLFFSFILQFLFCNAFANGIPDETSVLLSIKSGLVDPLHRLNDWGSSQPHCSWTGVGCNPAGHVDSLDLSRMNLTGDITDSITRLPDLVNLNLCCNQFTGPLPDGLANLRLLQCVDISSNSFTGTFPRGFGMFSVLRSVNASGNDFTGGLPEEIGNATSLESLDLRGCYFTGPIPVSYTTLGQLRFLGLSGNNLTGRIPPEIGRLSKLETMIIGYNEFDGSIPVEIGNLSNLQYLDMAVGKISGALPAELGKLQLLTALYLYNNDLDGEIPLEIGNMSSLTSLDLSDNAITGQIPVQFGQLSQLQLLNLMGNRLVGPIPTTLSGLSQLEVLALWNNSLTGSLPADLGRNSSLQWLDVSSNSLTLEIPTGLCDGGNLTKLILFNNGFTGPIPVSLAACQSLVRVRIQNNNITGTIPTGFGRLPRIERLELAGNFLNGTIPEDLSGSSTLSFVDVSLNRLESPLPPNILAIPTLQSFMASGNLLTGNVPDQFQDCQFLTVLDLSSNRLSGRIPESLASCRRLVDLDLSSNSLTGEIPAAFAGMTSLSIINLSDNKLTGAIPPDLGSSSALETVNLSNNSLTGPVPSNGVLRTINPIDLSGNPGLCGGILAPCSDGSITNDTGVKHVPSDWAIGILVVAATTLLALVARWVYLRWNPRQFCGDQFSGESNEWPWRLTAFQRVSFTSSDVLTCVTESNVIGVGATGVVYRAEMPRHRAVVAVKKLWRGVGSTGDVVAEEVSVVGKLRHRNVVRLIGTLQNDKDTMLVYEYVGNGSLWEALHGGVGGKGKKGGGGPMLVDWVARYNVALGVAQGLAYLHHDCHPPVIHRDVKSSNILLDGNMEAKIADFGLARQMMVGRCNAVSEVAGSHGYIAPEYGYTLKVDHKSDIYSFGVVLMELLTGRKPIDPTFADSQDIVGWVREKLRCNSPAEDVLDPTVGGRCTHVQEEMMLVLRIAVLCTARLPKDRPSMRDVVTMLAEAKPRRKSTGVSGSSATKDRPVFSPSPDRTGQP